MGQPINQKENKKIPGDKWKWKNNSPKSLGCRKSCPKRIVCSNTGLPQEAEKLQINHLNLYIRKLEKEQSPKTEGK